MQMSEHFDPGLLTITRTSEIPGLEVWDASIGQWVALEAEAAPNEVLIFAGEQLHALSGGLIPAVRHRVVGSRVAGAERCSVVFELRLLENVAQSVGRPTRGRAVGRPGSQVARVN
jgi:isopenicillin N synthase-like dioxygenase